MCSIGKSTNFQGFRVFDFALYLSFILFKSLVLYENQNQNDVVWEEKCPFRGFQIFDFALYLKSKTWKPR